MESGPKSPNREVSRCLSRSLCQKQKTHPGFSMAGFSGHGLMHGPVVGMLMAEEILDGRAQTVNIDPFRYDRFLAGELHPEYHVV
jgi:hypothetical protein